MSYSTAQREVLKEVLEQAQNPLTAEEIYRLGKAKKKSLGMATVYRALKNLEEDGYTSAVEIPGSTPRYEKKKPLHHHHFLCESCNRVFDLEGCLHEVEGLAPIKFQVKRHEIILYGACAECATK